jgi:hypothetical protein
MLEDLERTHSKKWVCFIPSRGAGGNTVKAYSIDLRTKIMRAVDAGMSKSEAARVFDVGLSTVKRYA